MSESFQDQCRYLNSVRNLFEIIQKSVRHMMEKNVFFSKIFENLENLRNESGSVRSGRKIWIQHKKWCRTAYSMPKTDVWRLWKKWKENVGGNSRNFVFQYFCFFAKQESASHPILAALDALRQARCCKWCEALSSKGRKVKMVRSTLLRGPKSENDRSNHI